MNLDTILNALGLVLDLPQIQGPAAVTVAAFLKAKLPQAVDKGLFDFLAAVAQAGKAGA